MSWYTKYRKYNKLAKELIYNKSELEYRLATVKEVHQDFEEYQLQYCLDRDIDLPKLKEQFQEEIKKHVFEASTVGNLNKEALAKTKQKTKEERRQSKNFSWVYKEVAKKTHPDKLSKRIRTEEVIEKEEMFKKASAAFKSHDWASLLEVSEALKVRPTIGHVLAVCADIEKSIVALKAKIAQEETRFGWLFANCETKACKDDLVKKILFQFFQIST
tara:strand:- start:178 stop:828 length:651 start_codon:yes stop_codon:yes gene_type:complete